MEDTEGIYDEVPHSLATQAGFVGRVVISRRLSDRLEVPEEWQGHYSFDERLSDVLAACRDSLRTDAGTRFKVIFPSNMTGRPEILELFLDVDVKGTFILDFTEA